MARSSYSGFEMIENQLGKLERESVRRIVEAGAEACAEKLKEDTSKYKHVGVTGSMQQNVRPGQYREFLGGGAMEVYPQDNDARGVSNAVKAYVINHGIGANPTKRSRKKQANKTGDKFITGNKKTTEEVVRRAMQAENDRILSESGG